MSMSAKVSVLVAAIFLALAFAFMGCGQQLQADTLAEKAAEEAEERAEKREEQAEEEAERVEEQAEEEAERAEEEAEERAEKRAKERVRNTESESRGPEEAMLKIEGDPETEFTGTCTVGDEENTISGQVPQSFHYDLSDEQKLKCEIRKQGTDAGSLKATVTAPGTHIVQQTNAGTMNLTYTNDGDISSSSSSGGQVSSSSRATSYSSQIVSSSSLRSSS